MTSAPVQALVLSTGMICGIGLFAVGATWSNGFDPNTVGLGRNTRTASAEFEGQNIARRGRDIHTIVNSIKAFAHAGKKIALWLGASQTHAINKMKAGDELAVTFANQSAKARGAATRYVLASDPNANFHEMWANLKVTLDDAPPDLVVIALTYDDLREPGVRRELHANYAREPIDAHVLDVEATSTSVEEALRSPQQRLEIFLNEAIEMALPAYQSRDRIRAKLWSLFRRAFATALFTLVRRPQEPIPADRQRWNMLAYDKIEAELAKRGIPLLVYQAPHRPGMRPFYHPRKPYDAFHRNLAKRIAASPQNKFIDLEALVPATHWGVTNAGQPDAFHFTVDGHRALGRAVDSAIAEMGL